GAGRHLADGCDRRCCRGSDPCQVGGADQRRRGASFGVKELAWGRLGRTSAWLFGGLVVAGGVLVTVVGVGIPPTEPGLARHYDYVRSIWPELYVSFRLFIAAFISLAPLGLALASFSGGTSARGGCTCRFWRRRSWACSGCLSSSGRRRPLCVTPPAPRRA